VPHAITQDDVWKARDEAFLEGARPTIDPVHRRIGRDS